MPDALPPDQRVAWQRREPTARNTLKIQAQAGPVANAETLVNFRRYVQGKVSLAVAFAQRRKQLAQEHSAFRPNLNRRNII